MPSKKELRAYAQRVGKLLRAHGFDLANVNSNDVNMQAAIRTFRQENGLGDGVVADAATFKALQKPVAARTIAGLGPQGSRAGARPKPVDPRRQALQATVAASTADFDKSFAAAQDQSAAQSAADKSASETGFAARLAAASAPPVKPAPSPNFRDADAGGAPRMDTGLRAPLKQAMDRRVNIINQNPIDMTPGKSPGQRPDVRVGEMGKAGNLIVDKVLRRRRRAKVLAAGG